MVLVSESPGEDHGAIGVVTLEDVIEELIGEEIVDETDVFVDVSRHLKRMNPAAAFAYHQHTFRRISSRQHSHDDSPTVLGNGMGGRTSRRGSFHMNPTVAPPGMKPLNKAAEPKPTTSTKVTIKPGTEGRTAQHNATVISSEERLLGKRQARQTSYGSIAQENETSDGSGEERRSRGSGTLIEERITFRNDGENGKVVISPVTQQSDEAEESDSLLLHRK